MYCVQNITSDLVYVGVSDRRLALFENVFPIPRGVSYNAYLVLDEKTVLLDAVEEAVAVRFQENLEHSLAGRPLDYVVVNHMEPDHSPVLRGGPLRPDCGGKGGGHPLLRTAHLHLCHGSHGPLAGGYGDL